MSQSEYVKEELFKEAIRRFDEATAVLMQYQRTLEDKVKELTQEIDRKKQLLDSILNSIDVGVVFFDEEGKIKVINNIACRLLNIDSCSVIDSTALPAKILESRIEPEHARAFDALISRMQVTDSNGLTIGDVLIFKDITRIKQLEAENERNRRLSAMGELILKIAHEIRNPLGSIELFASLLKQDLQGTEQGKYAERISHSVMSLVNTLDNMLRYSKGIKPTLSTCDIKLLIEELYGDFAETLRVSKIEFEGDLDGSSVLQADCNLIKQALTNLIINAIQAMPKGGRLSIKTKQHEDFLTITITDTGKGMDAETMAHIFEPFYSTKDRGTGLGMSITKSIIEAHRGSILVASEKDKGTEITIKLSIKPDVVLDSKS